MNIVMSAAIVVVAVAVAVGLLLLLRRLSPHGGHFDDTSRAAGVFSILATSFAVLLAFVVLFAFGTYDRSNASAETEAQMVLQQFEIAQDFPEADRSQLAAELQCYGRSVVAQEWPQMADGKPLGLNRWDTELFLTAAASKPVTPVEQAAYAKWLDERSEREQARNERALGEQGVIPSPLWFALVVTAGVVWAFVFLFADRREGAFVQGALIGAVTAVLVAGLLLVNFLDHPYRRGEGSIKPIAMQNTLREIDELTTTLDLTIPAICDERGRPL